MITHSEAAALIKRGRNGRKRLENNTYLYPRGEDYAVRLHYTDVVTIHADGTYTLSTGGWHTVTTKDRINSYGPARVYSERGEWAIWSADDPKSPAKVQKCRTCHGSGELHSEAQYASWDYVDGKYVTLDTPRLVSEAQDLPCGMCGGTGRRDYGSKPMPVIFEDGIRVDADGHVLDADTRERLNDPEREAKRRAAERAARKAQVEAEARYRAQQAARIDRGNECWLNEHKPGTTEAGEVLLFKAVRENLHSLHGTAYVPGTTVTAEDYARTTHCGQGLHFSPTIDDAWSYDSRASRYLVCAVDRPSMVALSTGEGAKVKAESCRVLYEVNADGERMAGPAHIQPELAATGMPVSS